MPAPAAEEGRRARDTLEARVEAFRIATRGLLLPLFTLPLVPEVLFETIRGRLAPLLGALLGLGLPWLAVALLRRGHRGDTANAALVMALATALVAWLGAEVGLVIPLLLAGLAWFATRLLYDGAVREVDPPPRAKPVPPAAPAAPDPIAIARGRLTRIAGVPQLSGITTAIGAVLDDLEARPAGLALARRFLAIHLDGLERIADRLAAGATPPEGLAQLLEDLQTAAYELRARLRAEESAALDIQVKVLAERLRQEGYA